jgi:hypothetical protein
VTPRVCHDCGGRPADGATFAGTRKPYGRADRCADCTADTLAAMTDRVAARRAEIAKLRAAGRFRAAKPFHTAPLFAGLRATPGGG